MRCQTRQLALGFEPKPILLPFRLARRLPQQVSALAYLLVRRLCHAALPPLDCAGATRSSVAGSSSFKRPLNLDGLASPVYCIDLARSLGTSVRTLREATWSVLGMRLHDYIRQKRLLAVQRSLLRGDA